MIIEGKFYRLTPVSDHSQYYDLELLYSVGGKNPRQEYKNAGYGLTLEHAIKIIIRFAVHNKFKDETITLKEYVEQLQTIKHSIEKQFGL